MEQWTALLISLGVELPVALSAGLVLRQERRHLVRLGLVALAATLLTHPFAWAASWYLRRLLPFGPRAAVIEATVVLVEGALYARVARLGWRRGLAVAAVANLASFAVGLAVVGSLR